VLQVQGLRKSYGVDEVLAGVSFVLHDGEHLGLVSPNGTGKSTLLRCLVGIEPPDGGSVTLSPPTLTIGYLPQALLPASGQTIATALGGPAFKGRYFRNE
jgi:ATP-binding cassette subfamily F protein 3